MKFLTVKEVAKAFRVSTMTVYRMLDRGDLPHVRIGHLVRIPERDVIAYVRRQSIGVR